MVAMSVTIARTVDDACAALAERPDALLLAGGTDLMVGVNRGQVRFDDVVVLDRVDELRGWRREGDELVLGAGLTYAEMVRGEIPTLVPALAQAARTVGSPQIRNAGTLGGNVATSSPAGDTLPVLTALDATIDLRSSQGTRQLPISRFVTGVKQNALEPGELIEAVRVPVLDGPQEFLKVGTRNAMVISVVSLALVVDRSGRNVRVGLGAVSPVPLRAVEAEAHVAGCIDWDTGSVPDTADVDRFAALVAGAARPIDDHRGTAAYRSHAVGVLARRALLRAFPGSAP
jgi:CO/xanthine dehydrogenase FAD-binding subunit